MSRRTKSMRRLELACRRLRDLRSRPPRRQQRPPRRVTTTSGAILPPKGAPMTLLTTALKLTLLLSSRCSRSPRAPPPRTVARSSPPAPAAPCRCIKKALVTPTSTSATVELETNGAAALTVSITKQTAATTTGGLTAARHQDDHIWAFARRPRLRSTASSRHDLRDRRQGDRSQAADGVPEGNVQDAAGEDPRACRPDHVDSGLGCAAECIETACSHR